MVFNSPGKTRIRKGSVTESTTLLLSLYSLHNEKLSSRRKSFNGEIDENDQESFLHFASAISILPFLSPLLLSPEEIQSSILKPPSPNSMHTSANFPPPNLTFPRFLGNFVPDIVVRPWVHLRLLNVSIFLSQFLHLRRSSSSAYFPRRLRRFHLVSLTGKKWTFREYDGGREGVLETAGR